MKTTLINKYPEEVSKIFYYLMFNTIEDKGNNFKTFDTFINIVDKMSVKISDDVEIRKVFKGDLLEIFAEIFFNCFESDPEVGILDYTPVSIEEDFGCDGQGINAAGNRVAVQVKFRNNPLDDITYEELAKTDCSAMRLLDINTSLPNSIYIFTSAFKVSHSAQTVLGKSLVILGKNEISYKVDNNVTFWNKAWELIRIHK